MKMKVKVITAGRARHAIDSQSELQQRRFAHIVGPRYHGRTAHVLKAGPLAAIWITKKGHEAW